MSDLRERFEKTETFKKTHYWAIEFDEVKQIYFSLHITHVSGAIAINSAWMMFQELNK